MLGGGLLRGVVLSGGVLGERFCEENIRTVEL